MSRTTAIVLRDPNAPDPPKPQRRRLSPGVATLVGAAIGHALDEAVSDGAEQHGLPPGLGSLALAVFTKVLAGGKSVDPADAAEMRGVGNGALAVGVAKLAKKYAPQEEPLVIEAKKKLGMIDVETEQPVRKRRRRSRP